MNAVVYARFSSHRQGEQSIEGQVAEAERFAKAVLKGHQHVQLLKDAGAHYGHGQEFVLIDGGLVGLRDFPAFGAVGDQIGNFYILLPVLNVLHHLILGG